jgi:hypothetical protein
MRPVRSRRLPQWNQARYSSSDAILEGGEAVLRRYIEIHTAGSDNRFGERCVEGGRVGQLPFDSIEQLWQFLLDRLWKP